MNHGATRCPRFGKSVEVGHTYDLELRDEETLMLITGDGYIQECTQQQDSLIQ